MKIVILERNTVGTDVDVSCFEQLGEVVAYPITAPDQVASRVEDADIIIANKSPLNPTTLANAKNVKMIAEFATGYDNIDIAYCKERGIRVANVSGYSTPAVVRIHLHLRFMFLSILLIMIIM